MQRILGIDLGEKRTGDRNIDFSMYAAIEAYAKYWINDDWFVLYRSDAKHGIPILRQQ